MLVSLSAARLLLLAAAVLFSTGGAVIKAASLTSWQVASFRSGIAAALIFALIPAARRGWTWRAWLVGIAYAATMVLFVAANKLTTSANAIFLQDTAPLYVVLLGPWLLHERTTREDIFYMAVVGLGLAMFFIGSEAPVYTAPNPLRGNLIALASSVTWALTIVGFRWLGRSSADAAVPTVVAGNLLAFGCCLPTAFPVAHFGWWDAAAVSYLGIFQIGLAYLCLTAGLRRVPAVEASTLLLVEPALNPIWAWLLHGERPSAWALAGGGTILLATLIKACWDNAKSNR